MRAQRTYSFPIFIPSTVTLFGAKMSNSASEPIDLNVTDASTASKRPQWTLPPLSTRSIQPAVAFCGTQGIYSIGGLAKVHISTM